jgi:hypothetical protein
MARAGATCSRPGRNSEHGGSCDRNCFGTRRNRIQSGATRSTAGNERPANTNGPTISNINPTEPLQIITGPDPKTTDDKSKAPMIHRKKRINTKRAEQCPQIGTDRLNAGRICMPRRFKMVGHRHITFDTTTRIVHVALFSAAGAAAGQGNRGGREEEGAGWQ